MSYNFVIGCIFAHSNYPRGKTERFAIYLSLGEVGITKVIQGEVNFF